VRQDGGNRTYSFNPWERMPMLRRQFLGLSCASAAALAFGCRQKQFARVMKPGEDQMVGSHAAGGEVYKPLIDEAMAKLLGNCSHGAQQVSYEGEVISPGVRRICFVGVENKSAEEIGDFKAQIYELIDARLSESNGQFQVVNRRFVDGALTSLRMRPEQLMTPQNMRMFVAQLEQENQPFDYMLWAVLTSGTTRENKDAQRDYLLTLELVDVQTGQQWKERATLSKGYHHSRVSRWTATNPFKMK
jgi:hypothetical protein